MKILLLDDQPNILKIMASGLRDCGHEIFCAHSMRDGDLVIDALKNKEESLDVVVIDLLLNRFEPSFTAEQSMVGKAMAMAKLAEIPSGQAFGRLGGEEFSMVLPESTLKNALTLAKHIQITWVQIPVQVRSMNINSTMSVGIAQISESDETFDELLNRADGMMYKAKQRGRNRVACR